MLNWLTRLSAQESFQIHEEIVQKSCIVDSLVLVVDLQSQYLGRSGVSIVRRRSCSTLELTMPITRSTFILAHIKREYDIVPVSKVGV